MIVGRFLNDRIAKRFSAANCATRLAELQYQRVLRMHRNERNCPYWTLFSPMRLKTFDGSSRAPNAIDQPGVCIGDLCAKFFRFASRRTN
jgi:hypothetical protein